MEDENNTLDKSGFIKELEKLINRYSIENGSDTPDFILAEYLKRCLMVGEYLIERREQWYGREKQMLGKIENGK